MEGNLVGRGLRFGIIVSRFNTTVTAKLLAGAKTALLEHGVEDSHVEVVYVPGSFEIPAVATLLAKKNLFDALICLGAIIRGETSHYEYIAHATAQGLAEISRLHVLPVTFGVITAETLDQALARSGGGQGNRGWDAAVSALEMATLFQEVRKK